MDLENPQEEYEWNSGVLDGEEVKNVEMQCLECGHIIDVKPRKKTRVLPLIFCDCEDNGPPFTKYRVEFEDGEIVTTPHFPAKEHNMRKHGRAL